MEDELERLWSRARRTPRELALWDELAAALARAGRLGEAAWRLRNLMLLAGKSEARQRAYLGMLRRHGHGLGDPGFQLGSSARESRAPDFRHLAVVRPPRGLVVYETRRGLVRLWEEDLGPAGILAWSRDGEALLLGGFAGDWPTARLELVRVSLGPTVGTRRGRLEMPGIGPEVCRLAVAGDLARLVAIERGGEVFTAELGELAEAGAEALEGELRDLPRCPGFDRVEGCMLDPAARHLLLWRKPKREVIAAVLDLDGGRWVVSQPVEGTVRTMAWAPDGRYAAVVLSRELSASVPANPFDDNDYGSPGSYLPLALVLEPGGGVGVLQGEAGERSEVWDAAAFRADGKLVLGGEAWDPAARRPIGAAAPAPKPRRSSLEASSRALGLSLHWSCSEWSDRSEVRETPSRRPLVHQHPIVRIQLSEDGRRLLTEEGRAKGVVWDTGSGLPLARVGEGADGLRLARDGTAWVGAGKGYRVVPIDRPGDAVVVPVRTYQPPHEGHYELADLAPDGRTVVLRGWPWGLEIMRVGEAEPIAANEHLGSSNRTLRFVDRGRKAAILRYPSIHDPTVLHVLAAGDLAELEAFPLVNLDWGRGDADLAELPDGTGLVVGAPGGPFVCRYGAGRAERLVACKAATGRFALSPDGREAALATKGGIELWALGPAPKRVGTLAPGLGPPRSLAYAPDGSFLYYTQDCHVRIWGREGIPR